MDKKSRSRNRPVRKWSYDEQCKLITYLRDNLPIESPTARVYYANFHKQTKIPIDWNLVRSKVRNLRVRYTQAKHWLHSNEAALLNEEYRKAKLQKICSFYDDFDQISKKYDMSTHLSDLSALKKFESIEPTASSQPNLVSPRNTLSSGFCDSDNDHTEHDQSFYDSIEAKIKTEEFVLQNSNEVSNSSYGEDYMMHNNSSYEAPNVMDHTLQQDIKDERDQSSSINSQIMLDKRLYREKKLALQAAKLNFKREKFIKRQELQKFKLESMERIRKLELEVQERIAMRKLHVKEKLVHVELNSKQN